MIVNPVELSAATQADEGGVPVFAEEGYGGIVHCHGSYSITPMELLS